MDLIEEIQRWMTYPNALGSEAQAAVIVGRVANALGQPIPDVVAAALNTLALRGIMRDIAQAIQRGEELNPIVPPYHHVVDVGAAAAGVNWANSIAVIAHHLDAALQQLG